MLTLTNALNIEGYTVFRDDANALTKTPPSGGESQNLNFYVLPEAPAIARDKKGNWVIELIVYRYDETRIAPADSTSDVGGGILTFTVELGVPKEKMEAIKSKLRTRIFGEGASAEQDVDLTLVPFLDGTVSVAVAGESTGDAGSEFVKGAVGTGKVSGIGDNRKAVMVKLTQAGASLMAQLDKLRTLPINVQYDLTFEHRLLGVTMHVWMDMNSSYTLMQEVFHQTEEFDPGMYSSDQRIQTDKITSVTETLVHNKTAGVTVTPATSEVEPDTLASLEKLGFDMLNKEMEKAIEASPPPAEMDRTYLTSFVSNNANNFNFTLDRKMVLVRNFRPSANISNVFQEGTFSDLVAFVDLRSGFFSFLKVPVRVNADFQKLPLDSVVVTVTYDRERFGGGGREQVRSSFQFTDGATIQTFLAYANTLEEVRYDWDAVVHYKGTTETFEIGERRFDKNFLVVDVGTLGMIEVDFGLGLVDPDKYPAAKVTFKYKSDALGRTLERDFKLDKTQETAVWMEAVHEEPTKGYEFKVDWLTKDGDILPGNWTTSISSRLRLDAPIADQLEVSINASGNFGSGPDQISQIGVSLVYKDPDNHYTEEEQIAFHADNEVQAWKVPLRNPDLRSYQYRYTIVYKDGLVRQVPSDGSWLDGEPGFITVGEKYVQRVDVFPGLLTFGENAKMVQVDFSYKDDANQIEQHDSLVFSSEDKAKKTWFVRGVPGGSKNYSYQIKYFSASGGVTELPMVTQDTEAIVIPPVGISAGRPAAVRPMIDLSVSTREVAGVDLAVDTEDPTVFFVLPPAPAVVVKDGIAAIQLLRLIQDGELSGGNLSLAVQLQHPPALLNRVQEELAAQLKRTSVALSPLPLKGAIADLQFVGRETTSDGGLTSPLRRSFLRTAAALDAPHTANFSITLTPDGVRLVEAALRSGGAPIGVSYLLTIEGLWPAQRILARIDWGRVYDHFSLNVKEGYLLSTTDILKITEDLVESRAINIQVVRGLADQPGSDDGTAAALAWIQRDLVERFCEPVLPLDREPAHASLGTFGEMFGVGSSFVAKKLTQIERAVAQIDVQQQRVVTRTIVSQAHLLDLLAGADPSQHIADAGLDHPFFRRMSLNVRSAQRLDALFLKEVVMDVKYGTAQGALRLTPDLGEAHFESWADASSDRTWSIQTEVAFADDAPLDPGKRFTLNPLRSDLRELTLDLRQMVGLVRVTIKAPVDTRIALSQVHLTHSRLDNLVGEADLAMAPETLDGVAWFRDFQAGDLITASVSYLLTDGRIVKVPPFLVDTEIIRLPSAFPGVLTVQIISDDDWSGLDRVIVALQKQPDSATGTFVFDKPSQVVAVNLDMPDPADRTFRYRMTRILSTGVEETDDWIQTDVAVVIAGRVSANRLIVDVNPIGPELPQAGIRLIEVELSYLDPANQVRDQKTMVIGARADHPRWEVAIQDPKQRTYEYRSTVYPIAGGPPQIGHWTKSTDRILPIPIVTIN